MSSHIRYSKYPVSIADICLGKRKWDFIGSLYLLKAQGGFNSMVSHLKVKVKANGWNKSMCYTSKGYQALWKE